MKHSISFCTVCMNRTMHLKETLRRNILDNIAYEHVEFVLLDYGSRDDLYDWAHKELGPYIAAGRLSYFSTKEPDFFHMSHSKNMALRLATGDILCSVDADNYTGSGFALYVNEAFNREANIFMAPPRIGAEKKWWDVQGRVCVRREDFYALRGYDEKVMDYGYEDQDFKNRLSVMGRRKVVIRDKAFLHAITHGDNLRIAEGFSARKARDLFISADRTVIIYLQDDQVFERYYLNTCQDLKQRYAGTYLSNGKELRCYKENGDELLKLVYKTNDHLASDGQPDFYRVSSPLLRDNFLLKRAIYMGKKIFSYNQENGNPVNCTGFGQGTVYKNFTTQRLNLL